jgi:hypothetical protein
MVDSDDVQILSDQPIPAQVVQRRHQQALDQVTMGPEQEQRRWRSNFWRSQGIAPR